MTTGLNTIHDAGQVCQGCGLCCSGLLFAKVNVYESDAAARRRVKLSADGPDTYAMPQPCQFLDGASCSIYADRPRNCRSYSCRTRDSIVEGTLGMDQARQNIQAAKDLLQQMEVPVQKYWDISIAKTGFRPFCDDFLHLIRFKLDQGETPTKEEHAILRRVSDVIKIVDPHFRKTGRRAMIDRAIAAIEVANNSID